MGVSECKVNQVEFTEDLRQYQQPGAFLALHVLYLPGHAENQKGVNTDVYLLWWLGCPSQPLNELFQTPTCEST